MDICRLADMPKNAARGFTLTGTKDGETVDIIVWRGGAAAATDFDFLRGFINKCPHLGLPLETFPDRFLNAAGDRLICSAHGAQFDAAGDCLAGPCEGDALRAVRLEIEHREGVDFIVLQP